MTDRGTAAGRLLRTGALARSVTVSISAGLLVDPEGYFEALTAYRSGDAAPIVDAMSGAAVAAIAKGGSWSATCAG